MSSEDETISKDPIASFVERLDLVPPSLEVTAQNVIREPFRRAGSVGAALKSALHGNWLHEPLHVVLTDIPIGAWTVTMAADAAAACGAGGKADNVADFALTVGLLGAAGAAITGIVDWSEIKQPAARRVGTAHAILNTVATTLFLASGILRRRDGKRPLARSLAAAGYVAVSLSAHLGGNLIYEHGIGLKRPIGKV